MKILILSFLLIIFGCTNQTSNLPTNAVVNVDGINAYPSPARDYISIYVDVHISSYIDLSIRSLYGEKLISIKVDSQVQGPKRYGANVSNLANGIYVAYLQTELSSAKCYFAVQHLK